MQVKSNDFIAVSDIAVIDEQLQAAVIKGTTNATAGRERAMFVHGEDHTLRIRQQAAEAKRRALRKLPDLLEQAETNMQANGINVLWANDADDVHQQLMQIVRKHHVKRIAKSKSMMTEEIGLNTLLEAQNLEVIETDLGEYIIQLNNEPPSHIIAPVLHRTKAEIRDIFVRELGMTPTDDAEEMVAFARQKLRDVFLDADMGISGGNFVIAETGTLGLVMNEGNGRMVTTLPRVHVAIIGIEKIVETVEDYALLTQVIARSGTGQNITVYTNIINAPRQNNDEDGPDEVYVIFVDNGRSDIYATKYAEALACIRCGACLNVCPVYRATGGHAYGWVYSGPIGAVITPLYTGLENASPLPYASSLCGACKQACPVDIDLPRMLLDLRHDIVEAGENGTMWDMGLKSWAIANSSPRLFEMGGKASQIGRNNFGGQDLPGVLGNWTKYREFPEFAPKTFRQLWRERKNNNG
ncbi:MAG: LutB/LldF family L-lactate oxidation iron-sulfur protein [Aggregatilineales bacterium]